MNLIKVVHAVTPAFKDVRHDVALLRLSYPALPASALSLLYSNKIRNRYTGVGVVTALPGVIPGMGTIAQAAIEAGSISADLALMLRWMAALCYGTGLIYGQDIEQEFDTAFTTVLGIWCGVVVPEKAAASKGSKLTVEHFDKHISERIANRMNQKIGQKLITKYGSKRGGVVLGKLIPFGIGAVVGGTFNYVTMQRFGKAADDYFRKSNENYVLE
jgi:hypothetical protein